jgi:hypothetical protein
MIYFYYLELLKEMPHLYKRCRISHHLCLTDATSRLIALTLSSRDVVCVPLLLSQCERYVVSLLSPTLVRCRIPRLDSELKIVLKLFSTHSLDGTCDISLHFSSIPDFLDM